MNKKIIAFVLIFSLFVSFGNFCSTVQASPIDALKAIGVATGSETSSGDSMTRSAFICMVVRMSGINPASFSGNTGNLPFTDIASGDTDFPYIMTAYELGLINGNGGGTFNGNSIVTLAQASKILVTLLGYKEKAEAIGGYPYGYLTIAKQKELFDGIAMSDTAEVLTAEDAYQLVMNALESSFSKISSIGDNTEYKDSRKMYMSQMLDIYKITGVVEQNEYTSLYGKSDLDINEIEIEGITLKSSDENIFEYIGFYVNCYFKEINGSNQIIYVETDESENNIININSHDIDSAATSVSELSYTKDNSDFKAKISSDAILIKNGRMATLTSSALCPVNGELTLISNDGDKSYDVIIAYDYKTIVAGSVSTVPGSIVDALGGRPLALDSQSNDYTFSIELNDEMIGLNNLFKNDVISYYEIEGDIATKKLKVSRNKVSGVVEEMDKSTNSIIIDGHKYYITTDAISKLLPGDMGDFYIDILGSIVHCDLTDGYSVYGFITKIGKSKGLDGKVSARIFTEKDRWVELDVQEKIKLNGEPKTADDLYALLSGKSELISYRVNADGVITSVTTAVDCLTDSERAEEALENDEFRLSQTVEGASYRQYLASFANYLSVGNNTIIFFVPKDISKDYEFFIGGKGNLVANQTYTKVLSYNENKTRVSDLLVVYADEGDSSDSEFMIYKSMSRVIIDGEELPCIYGSYGIHGETCVYINDDKVISSVGTMNQGDVIRFAFNKKGRVSKITKVYDFPDDTSNSVENWKETFKKGQISGSGLFDDYAYLSGIVTSVDVENMRFTLDYGAGVDALFGLNTYLKSIAVYDISDKQSYQIAPADLTEDDRVVVLCRQYQARAMVAFRD